MSPKDRKAFDNGIWLCQTCSVLIDRDENRFSVELLKSWKASAEEAAATELGKKLPSQQDAIDSLSMALTGLPKKFIPTAIKNIHQASTEALESLDPRFKIHSSFIGNTTHFELRAKQNVPVTLHIDPTYAHEYIEKYSRLLESGEDLEIESRAISFTGSKLLEEITAQGAEKGRFRISSSKRKATQKIWVESLDGNILEYFEDVLGEISFGSKEFSFVGYACNKLFKLEFRKPFTPEDTAASFSFTLNFEQWNNTDIRLLPYFQKIHRLITLLAKGELFFSALEIDGLRIMTSRSLQLHEMEYLKYLHWRLDYTAVAKAITSYLGIQVNFDSEVPLTFENFEELLNLAEIIGGEAIYPGSSMKSPPSCTLVLESDNLSELLAVTAPTEIAFVQQDPSEITIFGKTVTIPPRRFVFEAVTPRVTSTIDQDSSDRTVSLEFMPTGNTRMRVSFVN